MDTLKPFSLRFRDKAARKLRSAFSLVEVTLAIGVVSFAFVAVFGLLPTGLNTFHQAIDASVGSQIAQRVINDVQQTDFNTLISSGSASAGGSFVYKWTLVYGQQWTTRYFDNQGNEIVSASPSSLTAVEQQKVLYWVNTRITPVTVMPGSSSYANLATVTVQIVNNPGNQTLALDQNTNLWNTRLPMSTYSVLVARNIDQ